MKIYQSLSFGKSLRKISKTEKSALDEAINIIANNPAAGTEKRGDLKGIFIHKFKVKTNEFLLAYRLIGEDLELVMIGPHENYYRDLKNYLKDR